MRFNRYAKGKTGIGDNYATPETFYNKLNKEFHFDHDPCTLNPVSMRECDGLGKWGKRNYVNPPFSDKVPWIKKAIENQYKGNLTVMLLPVDTSTKWFHDLILPNARIRWMRGRLKFSPNKTPVKFATMICIFEPKMGG